LDKNKHIQLSPLSRTRKSLFSRLNNIDLRICFFFAKYLQNQKMYVLLQRQKMVNVAQSVRASDCGSEGRGFEPHLSPKQKLPQKGSFFRSKEI
jgi:hypothetical protein